MKVLHILISGNVGGVEKQCYNELLSSTNHYFLFIKREGIFAEQSISYGRTYYVLDNVKLSLKYINQCVKKIEQVIKENNIDRIIIEHTVDFIWLIALKLIRKGYSNLFVYMHSAYEDSLSSSKIRKAFENYLFKKLIKKSKGIIAISNYVKNSIINYFNIKKYETKIKVVYNGIILNNDTRPKLKYNQPIKFLYVGRIIKEKGIDNIIKCLENLNVDYVFYVVGKGPALEEYKTKYESSKIIFVGESNDVAKYYQDCDIFIHLPNWNEGFGITLIEAMNYGLPIISNYKGAIPEIVKNNVNGILLNDYNQFNTAVNNLLDNYNSYSTKSIEESRKYSIENTLKGIENL